MDYKEIKLISDVRVIVDFDQRISRCKKCNEVIRWSKTLLGQSVPIAAKGGGWMSHLDECKFGGGFIKSGLEGRIDDETRNQNFINTL